MKAGSGKPKQNATPLLATKSAMSPPPEKPKKQRTSRFKFLRDNLYALTLDALVDISKIFIGSKPPSSRKAEICESLAEVLDFSDAADFDAFWAAQTAILRDAIGEATWTGYVFVPELEARHSRQLFVEYLKYGYRLDRMLDEQCGLAGLFSIADPLHIVMPELFRQVFRHWLPKPAAYELKPVAPPAQPDPSAQNGESGPWSVEQSIAGIIPLAVDFILDFFDKKGRVDLIHKGFLVSESKRFRESCGMTGFPRAGEAGLDSGDLLSRFLAAFTPERLRRPEDSLDMVRALVDTFFDHEKARRTASEDSSALFEFRVLLAHLARKYGHYYNYLYFPQSRTFFRELLAAIAKLGGWFELSSLTDYCLHHDIQLSLGRSMDELVDLELKGECLEFRSSMYFKPDFDKTIAIGKPLHHLLVGKPLLESYFYLFASLGLVEITESDPERPVTRNGDAMPISPCDCLHAVRVTDTGAWCLGIRAEKPAIRKTESLFLPDPDLSVVAFKGVSLEKKLFLEQIGTRLGGDRYRVTQESFIAGCESPKKIEERIARFSALSDSGVPPLWEEFFRAIRDKIGIFSSPEHCYLFNLPREPAIRSVFTSDPSIVPLVRRVEGGGILVRTQDFPKLAALLASRGFFCLKPPAPRKQGGKKNRRT